jgi:thiosulfate reductase cytochrome b subunit
MAVHFLFMWFFALNGAFYVLYTIVSGEWRDLAPSPRSVRDAFLVALHDLGLRRTLPAQGKYNAAQKIAYSGVVMMGAGSVISGLAIYKPIQLSWLTSLLGGYESARLLHFCLTLGYLGFFAVHVAQVVRAGWSNFASMVAGFEPDTAGENDKNA